MAIRMVVCDLWGALLDGGDLVRAALRDTIAGGGPLLRPAVIAGVEGLAIPIAIQTLLEGHGRDDLFPLIPSMVADFERVFLDQLRQVVPLEPSGGAVAVLHTLRENGVVVGVQSALPRNLLDASLARVGWGADTRPFDASIATDEVARGRPWPDMIDRLRAELGGIASAEVAAVCNSPVGLQEGIVARCGLVIGVVGCGHDRESLATHPHDAIAASLADVPRLVAAHAS